MTGYQERMAAIAGPGYDPRHIEAWMRLEHGTLDALSPARFRDEVEMAIACITESGIEPSELLAKSYGL